MTNKHYPDPPRDFKWPDDYYKYNDNSKDAFFLVSKHLINVAMDRRGIDYETIARLIEKEKEVPKLANGEDMTCITDQDLPVPIYLIIDTTNNALVTAFFEDASGATEGSILNKNVKKMI